MTLDELFDDFVRKVNRDFLSGKEKDGYLKQLAVIKARYAGIRELNQESNIAVGLIERGNKLLKAGPLKPETIKAFIRHAKAAWYDLSGNLSAYTWYVRSFFAATIAFFILAPQFFGPILPLIFIIPVFFGLKGLKGRTMIGFTMSAMIFPMSLMASTNAARAFFTAILTGMGEFVASQAATYSISTGLATALVYIFAPVSVLGILSSVTGAVVGLRNREMFV